MKKLELDTGKLQTCLLLLWTIAFWLWEGHSGQWNWHSEV